MRVLNLVKKKKKSFAVVAEIHGKNTCSVHGIGKKEKNFMLGFAVEVTAPVHSECLVKTEKA